MTYGKNMREPKNLTRSSLADFQQSDPSIVREYARSEQIEIGEPWDRPSPCCSIGDTVYDEDYGRGTVVRAFAHSPRGKIKQSSLVVIFDNGDTMLSPCNLLSLSK